MLVALRFLLSVAFLVAAIGKLTQPPSFRKVLRAFGAPAYAAAILAVALPLAELAVACLLLRRSSARLGAIGALALLAIFSASLAVALLKGRSLECRCFGPLFRGQLGWPALARNVALLIAAGIVAAGGMR